MPEIDFRVVCSKGTYIRSLANDYGKALNSGAYLTALRRTRSGSFNIADAWNLTALIDEISVQRINWTAKETASIDESL
jgi:tRNA pseudouridine55 synthase